MKQIFRIAFAIPMYFTSARNLALIAGFTLFIPFNSNSQAVSGIITDYQGFWKTTSTAHNSNKPDDSHNLLAFTYNGVQYSTGVNDAMLTSHGETYVASDFWSLPVEQITSALTSNTKAGFGALYDGVASGPSAVPPTYGISMYLTDGVKGLNIGTCIANLPTGTMTLSISNILETSIGDGIPDILVTQIADPSGSSDRYEFTDENGVRVGNYMDIVFTHITPVATWTADFYEAKVNPLNLIPGFTQTDRPMRLWAADLSEFGITAANFHLIRNFRINLSGNSDVAFVAYNNKSVNFQNTLPVEYSYFKGKVADQKVQLNWQTVSEQDADKFIVERSADGVNYKAIGTVQAKNSSTTVNNYSFTDLSPLASRAFYRLKQVDLKGEYHHSSTIVKISNPKQNSFELNVYPNPAKGKVYIEHSPSSGLETVTLYNTSGMALKQQRTVANTANTLLDLSGIAPGVYYVTYGDKEKVSKQFVVSH